MEERALSARSSNQGNTFCYTHTIQLLSYAQQLVAVTKSFRVVLVVGTLKIRSCLTAIMPCSEILRIVTTIATLQMVCDLLAYWRVYSRAPYQHAVEKLYRFQAKWDQVQQQQQQAAAAAASTGIMGATSTNKKSTNSNSNSSRKQQEQNAKKLQRAENDYKNALTAVAGRHTLPNMATSVIFLVLMIVLGADFKGRIVALLPFAPFRWLRKMTARNLEFIHDDMDAAAAADDGGGDDVKSIMVQACSFTFIYVLTTTSVKFYVHQLFGYKAPRGADSLFALADSPLGRNCTFILLNWI